MPSSTGTPATIIVPAFNAESTIRACLNALARQSELAPGFEIIVVDDGSTDKTADIADQVDNVSVLRLAHHGAAAARNQGARHARSEILLFTDADCETDADWIRTMIAPFADPKVIGVRGVYRTRQREMVSRFIQCEYEAKYARLAPGSAIDFVDTYSAGYRRSLFLANNGFDESFPSSSVEDQELSFRLAEQGHRMIFVPAAVVYHKHPTTLSAYARKKFRIGFWKVRLHRRHPGKIWRDSHTPASQRYQVALFMVTLGVLFFTPFFPAALLLLFILVAAFFASAAPLFVFVARRDPVVAWIAPLMVVVRAAALAFGLAAGSLDLVSKSLLPKRRVDTVS